MNTSTPNPESGTTKPDFKSPHVIVQSGDHVYRCEREGLTINCFCSELSRFPGVPALVLTCNSEAEAVEWMKRPLLY